MRYPYWHVVACVLAFNGCTPKSEPAEAPGRVVSEMAKTVKIADTDEKVVRTVISELLKTEQSAIPMDKPIFGPPLNADELDLVEIVMELEERKGIEIPDEALANYMPEGSEKVTVGMTPNQLVSIITEASKRMQTKQKK